MQLHDAVGLNCKKAQLMKIKGQCQVYLLRDVCLMIVCVCVCVLLDLTTPPWWMDKVMVYYEQLIAYFHNPL